MRWLKHLTDTWADEKIAQLVQGGGKDGLSMYGAYWRVLEIVAGQTEPGDSKCGVQYSVTRWSALMSLRGSHVSHYLGHMAKIGLVTAEWIGTDIRVTIPNLLKYRDEYSRKSGHFPRARTETELDTETETDIAAVITTMQSFFPTADRVPAIATLKAARQAKPNITIPELCAALEAIGKTDGQNSAMMWRVTIPAYLRSPAGQNKTGPQLMRKPWAHMTVEERQAWNQRIEGKHG